MLLRVMLAFESTQNLDNRLARRWIVVVLEKSLQVRHQTFRASQRKDEAYAEICARPPKPTCADCRPCLPPAGSFLNSSLETMDYLDANGLICWPPILQHPLAVPQRESLKPEGSAWIDGEPLKS